MRFEDIRVGMKLKYTGFVSTVIYTVIAKNEVGAWVNWPSSNSTTIGSVISAESFQRYKPYVEPPRQVREYDIVWITPVKQHPVQTVSPELHRRNQTTERIEAVQRVKVLKREPLVYTE